MGEGGILNVSAANGVLANDTDPDLPSDLLCRPPSTSRRRTGAGFTFNADGSFDYTPNPGFNGVDTFTYHDTDLAAASSNVATVTILVDDPPVVNDDPIASPPAALDPDPLFYQVDEDQTLTVDPANGVLVNDFDPNTGDVVRVFSHTSPLVGGPLSLSLDDNTGGFTYTPPLNYNGTDELTYRATDGTLLSAMPPATVTITIVPVNDPPVAVDDPGSGEIWVNEGQSVDINVLANDGDVDGNLVPSTIVIGTGPSHGTITNIDPGTGVIQRQADTGVAGVPPITDSFAYTVDDDDAAARADLQRRLGHGAHQPHAYLHRRQLLGLRRLRP